MTTVSVRIVRCGYVLWRGLTGHARRQWRWADCLMRFVSSVTLV